MFCVHLGFPHHPKHVRSIFSQHPGPRNWLTIWSWSPSVVLWLPTVPPGWVKCRDQISLYTVYVTSKVPLLNPSSDYLFESATFSSLILQNQPAALMFAPVYTSSTVCCTSERLRFCVHLYVFLTFRHQREVC